MKRRLSAYSDFKQNNSAYRTHGRSSVSVGSDIYSVVSLAHGTGCTHMAVALANYISRITREEKVALVIGKEDEGSDFIKNHVASKVDVLINGEKRAEEYRLRVYDVGVVLINGEPERDLVDRSSDTVGQRFVICNDNEDYYYFLDKYTRNSSRTMSHTYLFNRIPRISYKRVVDVMADYSYNFIPSFRIDKLEDVSGLFEMYVRC